MTTTTAPNSLAIALEQAQEWRKRLIAPRFRRVCQGVIRQEKEGVAFNHLRNRLSKTLGRKNNSLILSMVQLQLPDLHRHILLEDGSKSLQGMMDILRQHAAVARVLTDQPFVTSDRSATLHEVGLAQTQLYDLGILMTDVQAQFSVVGPSNELEADTLFYLIASGLSEARQGQMTALLTSTTHEEFMTAIDRQAAAFRTLRGPWGVLNYYKDIVLDGTKIGLPLP